VYVGAPALLARVGDGLAPWLVELTLGTVGLRALQTREPAEPREGNLFGPLPGDPGAHGRFRRTFRRSPATWAARHPVVLSTGAAAVVGEALRRRRRAR
jgi:hypothetical protein